MLYSLVRSINVLFDVLVWLIIARSLASILVRDYRNPLVRVLYEITEPILIPFRAIMQKLNLNMGMIDFSPFLAIIALNMARRLIWGIVF